MKISTKAWLDYINKMSKISNTAADLMQKWIQKNGFTNDKALLDYAYALSAHYGEAIAELSCQMYEATARAQKASIPSAEPAEVPEYGEVAKAVHGTMKQSQSLVPSTIGRLVKQVGADTTLKNAIRDGAEFAWVPHGDTCAFCITLASRGWQKVSKNTLRKGHAEHIHANCDCQYAVRFDGSSTVEGYDPDKYLEIYENSEGSTPQEKINSMRRELSKREKGIDVTSEYLEKSTPGKGNIEFDGGYKEGKHINEIKCANWLVDTFGGDIKLLNESDQISVKTPDYLWNGKLWDLKTTQTEKAADSAIRHGIKQIIDNPGGMILDYGDNDISIDDLRKIISARVSRSQTIYEGGIDIIVKRNGKKVKVFRYKK